MLDEIGLSPKLFIEYTEEFGGQQRMGELLSSMKAKGEHVLKAVERWPTDKAIELIELVKPPLSPTDMLNGMQDWKRLGDVVKVSEHGARSTAHGARRTGHGARRTAHGARRTEHG